MSEDLKSVPTKPTTGTRGTPKPSPEFLAALKREMLVTAATLGANLDEMGIVGYLEALSGMRTELMIAAFRKLRREYKFHNMPLPAEILEAASVERERAEFSRPRLAEATTQWTDQERQDWSKQMASVAKTIGASMLSDEEIEKRKEVLRKQAAELAEKWKVKGA